MANILLISKDLPDGLDFAQSLATDNNLVFSSQKQNTDSADFANEKILTTTWNRASAISAHSYLIKAENKLGNIENVVFCFDSAYFASIFSDEKTEDVVNGINTMITSYIYEAKELIKRIDQKRQNIGVCFLLKDYPARYENLSSKNPVENPLPQIVSIAENSFIALAESFATYVQDREYLNVLLARSSYGSEFYNATEANARWILQSLDQLKNQRTHQSFKQAAVWNKVGTKLQLGFSLFK